MFKFVNELEIRGALAQVGLAAPQIDDLIERAYAKRIEQTTTACCPYREDQINPALRIVKCEPQNWGYYTTPREWERDPWIIYLIAGAKSAQICIAYQTDEIRPQMWTDFAALN